MLRDFLSYIEFSVRGRRFGAFYQLILSGIDPLFIYFFHFHLCFLHLFFVRYGLLVLFSVLSRDVFYACIIIFTLFVAVSLIPPFALLVLKFLYFKKTLIPISLLEVSYDVSYLIRSLIYSDFASNYRYSILLIYLFLLLVLLIRLGIHITYQSIPKRMYTRRTSRYLLKSKFINFEIYPNSSLTFSIFCSLPKFSVPSSLVSL